MLLSTLAFACMNAVVKHLDAINAYQIVFFRSFGSLFFTFGFLIKNKIPIVGKNNTLLILRAITGTTSMLLFFMSIKYLAIGTAVSLRYTAPIFATIFAAFIFKEHIKPIQWCFFLMSFLGVLVIKGLDTDINTYGLILVLLAAILSGLVFIIINKIGQSEHPVVIVNYFMVTATIMGGILSIGHWIQPQGIEWILLFSLGVFGYFGQIYMTKAFQLAATTIVAPFKYVEVVFTALLGIFIFHEVYTFWSVLGIILIIGGLMLNQWFKSK